MPFRVPVTTQDPIGITTVDKKVSRRCYRLLRPNLGATTNVIVRIPHGVLWRIIEVYVSITYGAVDQQQYMWNTIRNADVPNGQGNALFEMLSCPFIASTRQVSVFSIGGGGTTVAIPGATPANVVYQPLPDMWLSETDCIDITMFNPTATEGFLLQIGYEEVLV